MRKKDVLKKMRRSVRREVSDHFPVFLAAKVYTLPILDRLKIALMIIKRG